MMLHHTTFLLESIGFIVVLLPWSTHAFQVTVSPTSKIVPQLLQQHQRQLVAVAPSSKQQHYSYLSPSRLYCPRRNNHNPRRGGCGPLFYRELEEDDDDAAMLKVQSRTPIGFDMRRALQQKQKEEEEEEEEDQSEGDDQQKLLLLQRRQQQMRAPRNALNVPLIRALQLNQVLILAIASIIAAVVLFFSDGFEAFSHLDEILHWSGGDSSTASSLFHLQLTPLRLLEGLIGAIPLVVLGNFIENSDDRAFANVNFSTIVMTLTLFGRRRAPPPEFIPDKYKGRKVLTTSSFDALLQSFTLSSLTGICEETVFRAELPAILTHVFHFNVPLAVLTQAFLFGLGHAQPSSSGSSPSLINRMENIILIGLQFINGISLALLYIFTGGDIVPCMIAHAAYDLITFFKTWWDANGQLEYAEQMFLEPLPPDVEAEVRRVLAKSSGTTKLDPVAFNAIKRLFYIFDFDKNKTLSKSEVRKGISYLALEKAGVPPPQEIVDQAFEQVVNTRDVDVKSGVPQDRNRLSFSDFMRLYMTMYNLKSREMASVASMPQP